MTRVAIWERKSPITKRISFYLRWADPTTGQLQRPSLGIKTGPKPNKTELRECRDRAEDCRRDKQRQLEGDTPREYLIPMYLNSAPDAYASWMSQIGPDGIPNAADGTIANVIRHVSEFLGYLEGRTTPRRTPMFIGTILRYDIAHWRDTLLQRGLSAGTINGMIASLSGWFEWAIDHGHAQTNPSAKIRRFKVKRERPVLPVRTPEDLWQLAGAFNDPTQRGSIVLLACTGLRQGELRALRPRDVDLDARTITVRRGRERTKRHARTIPLPAQAVEAIGALSQGEYLLMEKNGKKPLVRHLNTWLTPHGVKPHDLRRFYITALETLGAPQRIIDDLVAHSSGVREAYTPAENLAAAWPWILKLEKWLGNPPAFGSEPAPQ